MAVKNPAQDKDSIGHGRLDRIKTLLNAALRLWELKQESPQYSSQGKHTGKSHEKPSNGSPPRKAK